MTAPEHYILPIDREMFDNVDDICTALLQTKELSYDTREDVQEAVLISLMEYLIGTDWTGMEFLLEFGKVDLDAVSFHLLRNLLYRLSDMNVARYPRLHAGVHALKDIFKYRREPLFITQVILDEKSRTMLVKITFDPE